MKKELLVSVFLFFNFTSLSQLDTTYYRLHSSYPSWVTTSKDSAQFYCITPFEKVGNLFHLKYYYANGNLLEEGFSENTRGSKKQGKYSYYDKSGRKTIEKNYTDGYIDGKQLSFFKDGTIQTSGVRKNKQWYSGTFLLAEGVYRGIDEYKNGEQIGSFRFYSDSKQIAEKLINGKKDDGEKLDFNNATRIYYDRNGNEIGRLKRSGGRPDGDGIRINFYDSDNLVYAISVQSKIPYVNGKRNGEAIFYDKKGKVIAKGIYKNGFKHSGVFYEGDTFLHYENGVQREKVLGYNKDGEIVSSGTIKNEEPWEGTFTNPYSYISKSEINSYVEGKIEGKQTYFYDRDFKQIHFYQHLVNDRKEGKFALFDKEGNQLSKGIYKDEEPWEGTFYDERNRETSTYEEGNLHGDFFQLNQKGDTIYFATYQYGKKNGFVKTINPNNGKRHECYFRNGNPSAGELYERDENSLFIFDERELTERHRYGYDGDKSIPYQIEKYKNNEIVELIFNEQGQQYHLILKDGEPFEGVDPRDYKMITYKNGKKHGAFHSEYIYNNTYAYGQYFQDSLDKKITFYDRETNDSTFCIYKKGTPINGTAWNKNIQSNYKNGIKHGTETEFYFSENINRIIRTYKNGKLHGPITFKKDDLKIEEGFYKKNKPYKGSFYKKGERAIVNKRHSFRGAEMIYTFTRYKKGKKEGIENTYGEADGKLLTTNEYKENKLIASSVFDVELNGKKEWKGFYKKEKPYDGEFIEVINWKLITIKSLRKGNLEKIYFIHKNGNDTLIFKNQKPFSGSQIEVVDEKVFQHIFKQGNLTQTLFSYYEVNYSPDGFETKEKSCEDCLIHKVEFTNINKTSGLVTFGKKQPDDFIRFADGKIVEMNIKTEGYDNEKINWMMGDSKPTLKLVAQKRDIIIQFESDFQWNPKMMYFDFLNIEEELFRNGNIFYSLKNHQKPFASLSVVNRKHFHGIEIKQDGDGLFYLERMVNGKEILDKEGITLEEVLKICKEH